MPSDASNSNGRSDRRSWGEAVTVYRHPRVLAMLFLGFSAGLPFLLVFSTLSAWLTEAGIDRADIGYLSWLGITYSIKVFWAPVVDNLKLPGLTRLLGRRRSWMLVAQAGIAAGLFGLATSDPAVSLAPVIAFGFLVAFSSATQDVAIDAYRIEAVKKDLQGAMAATYQLGYRFGLLAAGAGALYMADFFTWFAAYTTMALLVGVGIVTVLIIHEPEINKDRLEVLKLPEVKAFLGGRPATGRLAVAAWLYGAAVCPFVDFFRRNGRMALVILMLVAFYRISDITMGVMANPFYIDLGFTKSQIASVSKLYGLVMSLAGAFIGGVLVVRFGLLRPLFLGALLVAVTNLLFATLANVGPDLGFLVVTISADNLAGGLAGSVFIAYLSSLTSSSYTATQYALFSSLMTLPGKFIGGFSGEVVEALGYHSFFLYAAVLGIPAMLLVIWVGRLEVLRSARLESTAESA